MHAAPCSARWLPLLAAGLLGGAAIAQEVRFANGAPVKGEVKAVSPEGMEIQSGATSRLYPWNTLSAGTRFRFDPVYRVNLASIQKGEPAAARTNEPESGYVTSPGTEAEPVAAEGDAEPAVPVDFDHYEPAKPLPRENIPDLTLRSPDAATSWGLRYGRSAGEVVYFVFDTRAAGDAPDGLVIYTPANGRTDRIKAARRSDRGDALMQFRKLRYQGAFGDAKASMDVACSFSSRDAGALLVSVDVELTRGAQSCAFTLQGAPPGTAQGNVLITPREILLAPSLWMATDTSSGRHVLVGNIRMGRLKLLPKRGMDLMVSVSILDEAGKPVLEESLTPALSSPLDRHTISLGLDKLTPGRKYALKASVDLGPLFGRLRYEESMVLPDVVGR